MLGNDRSRKSVRLTKKFALELPPVPWYSTRSRTDQMKEVRFGGDMELDEYIKTSQRITYKNNSKSSTKVWHALLSLTRVADINCQVPYSKVSALIMLLHCISVYRLHRLSHCVTLATDLTVIHARHISRTFDLTAICVICISRTFRLF